MSRNDVPPSDVADAATPEDAEVARVLDLYLAGIEAGHSAEPGRLIADHPAIAGQLRLCLRVMNLADRMVGASGSGSGMRQPVSRLASTVLPQAQSVLSTLGPGAGSPPHVQLRDVFNESEPIIKPRSDEMPVQDGATIGRFQLQGEIARGGMGAILKGRDVDLGRELAIKVLLEGHQGDTQVVQRFIEEAQIGGQLQHPGVVPVYEMGAFPDRRPYFAMKLVKGRTLASLLHERTGPEQDVPRFLAIFEPVCQTMAYAHARGVIHRDLKPSNVMVGSFGEVQVMDWGLAKVLASGGIADEVPVQAVHETAVRTVRSGSAGSVNESRAGSVLGTPSYMAPEQARGDVERIDERADVFGLGAILCEILTGLPPFVGPTREEIRGRAARGEMDSAWDRLEASGADRDLIDLARDCLAAERERRPRNAGAVVDRVKSYLSGVQERLRLAELARVQAQTRVEESDARARVERSRRRRTVALAASVLVTVGLAGGGSAYLSQQRLERAFRFDQALAEFKVLHADAERVGDDLARWQATREAAHAVERLLADAPDQSARANAAELLRPVAEELAAAENDQKLRSTLSDIRITWTDDRNGSARESAYMHVFREAGIDIDTLSTAQAAAKIGARSAATRMALASALDDWAELRRKTGDHAAAVRITEVARLADPDPSRNRIRELFRTTSRQTRLKGLQDIATSTKTDGAPAMTLRLLGASLNSMRDATTSAAILRAAQRAFPGDARLNYLLAECLEGQGRREESIRYYFAARSLQPETAHALAHALEEIGETDQAILVFEDMTRLRPKVAGNLVCLGASLKRRGRRQDAMVAFEAAVGALREELATNPDQAEAYSTLGDALDELGRGSEAIEAYREAARRLPGSWEVHNNLGTALAKQGRLTESVDEFRAAVRLERGSVVSRTHLGEALDQQGKLVDANDEMQFGSGPTTIGPIAASGSPLSLSVDSREQSTNSARHCGSSRTTPRRTITSE